jgi:hypothetical protein
MITATNGLGQETSKDNTNQLNEGNANPNTGKHTCLVFDLLGELRDASDCPESFVSVGTQDHIGSAANCVLLATAVWDIDAMAEGCVCPVSVILDTTAVNLKI